MENPRRWHAAVAATTAVLAAMLLLVEGLPPARMFGALAALGVFAAGRLRRNCSYPRPPSRPICCTRSRSSA